MIDNPNEWKEEEQLNKNHGLQRGILELTLRTGKQHPMGDDSKGKRNSGKLAVL